MEINRVSISYKIKQKHIKKALAMLKKNEQITMKELCKLLKKEFEDFDITPQHLGSVLRDNNITRKRTRHEHFPKERYNKPLDRAAELKKFYENIKKYSISKIISIDETSVKPQMLKEYSRCGLGKRCLVKTEDNKFFTKYTLLVAISNKKCIGWKLYEKGAVNKQRFIQFLKQNILSKYKKRLLVFDNASCHRNDDVRNAILESGNFYQYSVPYTPKTNAIEMFFNQIKHYLKLHKKVLKFKELEKEVKNAIKEVKPINYKNYFEFAYNKKKDYQRNKSNLWRTPKNYKK